MGAQASCSCELSRPGESADAMLIARRTAIALGAAASASLAVPRASARPKDVPAPADSLEINTLLMQLAWAIDTANAADAAAVFQRDAVVYDLDGIVWKKTNGGALAFLQSCIAAGERGVQHHVQINRLESAGNRWLAESYWSQVGWKTGSPRPELMTLGAYVDRLAQRNGRWLITERRVSLWNSQTVRVPVVKEPGQ